MSPGTALLVDLGNSRLKWAVLANGAIGAATAAAHAGADIGPGVLSAWERLPPPARVLVGSVAGVGRDDQLRALCQRLWACEPRFVRAGARAAGVVSGYLSPEQLGVDRWLGLLAAHADGRGAACVVDCGTAVTIDVIDDVGRHRGGLILPGLQLMRDALLARTRIPPITAPQPRLALGRDTGAAVVNGALVAVVGAVRETLARASGLGDTAVRLVVAGGDAAALAAALDEPVELRPHLVLEGLAVLAGTEET